MSSGTTAVLSGGNPQKNILNSNNNNNNNSSASNAATVPAKAVGKAVSAEYQAAPVESRNGDTNAHLNNNVNSNHNHNISSNGQQMQGGDTVDKALVAPTALLHLSEAVRGEEKTTIGGSESLQRSRDDAVNGALEMARSDSGTSCNNNNDFIDNTNDGGSATADAVIDITTTQSAGPQTTTTTAVPATASDTLKKKQRASSGRQQAKKAKRVRFYRNGDKFYPGLVIPVSNERYRSFESLTEDLTRVLGESSKVPGAVRTIYSLEGKKVATLEDLEDGKCYVCSCNNEVFKKLDYSPNNKLNNRLSRVFRPSSPHKSNGSPMINGAASSNGGSPTVNLSERDTVVFPRIVTLIRNGVKPRKIFRLLLNKRNSPSFEHVLTAITQRVNLDTGCVRKVFSLDGGGIPCLSLADFFQHDVDVFFAYGNERVGADDFELDAEELRQIHQLHKTLKSSGRALPGAAKPKMPGKSHNETFECVDENFLMIGLQGNDALPQEIRTRYTIGQIIGDGNFAVVLRVTEKATNKDFALKIIDKNKCLGKEHYIVDEIRIMKQLEHPHIISLISDKDTARHMYLVMELVNGGDLFDAITRVTRFSEAQSRVMIRHLASAMAYLHSMGIVHRDIKPENLLVELDEHGNVLVLKLADFGLACEVDEPLLAVCGTPTYVAPEILMETGYGLKIDVWAAGIILYILLCGFPPFVSPDNQQEPLFDAILSGVYDFPEPYWTDIGDGVRDLIANMLQSDPELRFSSEDILDHFWVLEDVVCGDQLRH